MNPMRCSKCLVHGISTMHHPIECVNNNCNCQKCKLIDLRTDLIGKIVPNKQKAEAEIKCTSSRIQEERRDINKNIYSNFLTQEAKVILDLIQVLSVDPSSFNPDNFDYPALANFFNKETIDLPIEWLPQLSNIFDLVHEALKRFPILKDINFPRGVVRVV